MSMLKKMLCFQSTLYSALMVAPSLYAPRTPEPVAESATAAPSAAHALQLPQPTTVSVSTSCKSLEDACADHHSAYQTLLTLLGLQKDPLAQQLHRIHQAEEVKAQQAEHELDAEKARLSQDSETLTRQLGYLENFGQQAQTIRRTVGAVSGALFLAVPCVADLTQQQLMQYTLNSQSCAQIFTVPLGNIPQFVSEETPEQARTRYIDTARTALLDRQAEISKKNALIAAQQDEMRASHTAAQTKRTQQSDFASACAFSLNPAQSRALGDLKLAYQFYANTLRAIQAYRTTAQDTQTAKQQATASADDSEALYTNAQARATHLQAAVAQFTRTCAPDLQAHMAQTLALTTQYFPQDSQAGTSAQT